MKRRTFLHLIPAGAAAPPLLSAQTQPGGLLVVAKSFADPPASARPRTWWHWMNGNITADGITRDLEAMARIGVRGVQIFQAGTGIPKGPVDYGSQEHLKLLVHALNEAERLGIECDFHNCPGWSSSGGPWNGPEHSMKVVTWTERTVEGGRRVQLPLPQPPARLNFYRDIAVVAFPAPAGERPQRPLVRAARAATQQGAAPVELGAAEIDALFGDDPRSGVTVVPGGQNAPGTLTVEFTEPVEVRSVSFYAVPAGPGGGGFGAPGGAASLEHSADGARWEKACDLNLNTGNVLDGWPLAPVSASFAAVRGRFFRITLPQARRVSVLRLSGAPRLQNWAVKANYLHHSRGRASELDAPTPDAPAASAIDPGRIVDLTSRMRPDGTLEWDAPAGMWTVLRIGYTTTARTNHPAPDGGAGLECDKYSAAAMDHHFQGFFGPILKDLERLGRRGLAGGLIDSYEVGMQNWTDRFAEEFRSRAGYDLLRYLPAFTGRIVGSVETTERFLWDVRRVQADLMADNYYGRFSELCHRHGIKSYTEPYDGGPFDEVQIGMRVDIPMGEFWFARRGELDRSMKLASSVAHLKGHSVVGAESFTGAPMFSRWQEHPYALKAQGDWMYTHGLTLCIFHRYAHQPHPSVLPGMTMGPWGFHFDRTNTWFEKAGPWIDYLSRCQYLLQQGQPAADLLYFTGEDAPVDTPAPEALNPPLPSGYDFDFLNAETLLRRVGFSQGRIRVEGGAEYRLLVLPERRTMTLRVLRKLHELVRAGMWLSGPRPLRSPSLADSASEAEWKKLADELWGRANGSTVRENTLGHGRVFWGLPLAEILSRMGVPPDFECTSRSGDAPVNFIHRRVGDDDVYFVACRRRQPEDIVASFRVAGKRPEIWLADSAAMAPAPVFEVRNGRTLLPLQLDPAGSAFVVFRNQPPHRAVTAVTRDGAAVPVLAAAPFPQPAPGRQAKTSGTFTVSVWCKPDSFATLTPPRTSGWSPAGDLHSFLFYPPAGETLYGQGHAACGLVAGRNGVSVIERACAALEAVLVVEAGLSGWTHIALVYQDNTPSVYIDGRLVSRGQRSRFTVHPGVGESFQSDGAGYFEGDQCAPEVVPKALSEAEIAAMVQQGPPRFTPHRAVEIALLPGPGLLVWEPGRWRVQGVQAAEIQAAPPPAVEVAGPWTVSFPPGLGAPASIRLDRLIPLQRHSDPGVRHFSGTARYEADFAWNHELKPSQRACLDLGRVAVIAQVSLNGQPAGQFWKPPFRADVTSLLRRGANRLEVQVTNLWVNRLIGDEQLPPEAEYGAGGMARAGFGNAIQKLPDWFVKGQPKPPGGRVTFTTWKHWDANSPLTEAGLIGPVRIEVAEFWPLPGLS
ncbi:MAG: hypothetical protein KatS3mg004_0847 [Bryobacteraceae bacterium]|nr:MAG: hypothetical protein KatS3mg004_0847 [Bryobacteraceae bacterium]